LGEILFVEGDEEHDGDAAAHAQNLQGQLLEVRVGGKWAGAVLEHRVRRNDLDQVTRCCNEDPGQNRFVPMKAG